MCIKMIKPMIYGCYFAISNFAFAASSLSTKPYLHNRAPDIKTVLNRIKREQIEQAAKAPKTVTFNYLSIISPSLTPGQVRVRAIDFPQLLQPVFLVGSDRRSIRWLAEYAPRLRQLHALGLLVQANSKEDVVRVRQVGDGLTIVPVSGEQMAKRLGIQHYPVLISKTTIEQ